MVIHQSAVIADDAAIAEGASIGPFCVMGVDGTGMALAVGQSAVARSHTVIYRNVSIGDAFHAGHGVLVRDRTVIGTNVSIGSHCVIEHSVTLEDNVRIHSNCFVPELSLVRTGAWLGPGVIVTNARYPNRPETKDKLEGVTIGRGAVIGAGAVLLPGVVIGDHALVGAGAVVARDVPPDTTVFGNPAKARQ